MSDSQPESSEVAVLREQLQSSEEQLRASEERFRGIFETASAGIGCIGFDGRFEGANARLCEIFGYREAELVGLPLTKLVYPEDLALNVQQLMLLQRGKQSSVCFETRCLRKDGSVTWVLASPSVVYDGAGKPRFAIGHVIDINATKRAEEALRASEARYRAYVDNAPDGVFVIDERGRYADVNVVACTMTGYTREELLSLSIYDLAATEVRTGVMAALAGLNETGRLSRDTALSRKDGSVVHVALLASRVGERRFLALCRDLTERRARDEQRRRLEVAMQQAQKLESLGVLAGGVAHDFNNLLVGILGSAELARESVASGSPAAEELQTIEQIATSAADLCRSLLAYSGGRPLEPQVVDLRDVLLEMRALLRAACAGRAQIRYKLPAGLPCIRADATQIRQVVLNLVTNAAEALDSGAGEILIAVGRREVDTDELARAHVGAELAAGSVLTLEVSDEGMGMDEVTRASMFEPFFTTKFTGRGLGLASVLGIVHAHGGAVCVESRPGEGTKVTVLLPHLDAAAAVVRHDRKIAPGADPTAKTVLVIDDEPVVRETTRKMLESSGYTVIVGDGGREGLKLFEQSAGLISCVLLDLTMPEMDGAEVLAKLRQRCEETPVIIISGYGSDRVRRRLGDLAVAGVLEKPFRLSELRAKLERVLRSRPSG